MEPYIIDSHAHCGIQDRFFSQTFEDYLNFISGTDIQGAVFFAPVIEIYYGSPKSELEKIMRLPISEDDIEAIIGGNLKRLLANSNL
jgi:hypothetical protein